MSNKNNLSEATFESQAAEYLRNIFPTFDEQEITLQKSFTLRFGHHNILVDNKQRSKAMGRLDLLISINEKPVAIFEFKKPSIQLTSKDVEQGISYARLTNPITPLTIVSNGVTTELYNTYTAEKLSVATIDELTLTSIIENGLILASNLKNDAITLLLGEDVEIFSQIIKDISKTNFSPFIGDVKDFSKPIGEEFIIPRHVAEQLLEDSKKNHLLILIGDALSGKTNVLYQISQKAQFPECSVYFVDGSSSYGVFLQLANHLSKELKIPIDSNKVRNWVINGFIANANYSLLLLLDNWTDDVHPNLKTELLELVDLFRDSGNSIVLAINTKNFNLISTQKGRLTNNIIGHEGKKIKLTKLNENEFNEANSHLLDYCKHFLGLGAKFHPWYLQPRSLRILAGTFKDDLAVDEKLHENDSNLNTILFEIPSIPDDWIFDKIEKIPLTQEFIIYLKSHARCFIEEGFEMSPELQLLRYSNGAVTYEKMCKEINEEEINSFINQGFLKTEYTSNTKLLYPILIESISLYSIEYICKRILRTHKESGLKIAYEDYLKCCEGLPYGDIVGVKVLKIIGGIDPELYGDIFNILLDDEPKIDTVSDESIVIAKFNETQPVKIKIEGASDEKFISNVLPWSIASRLLIHPTIANGESFPYEFFFKIIYKLGNYKESILYFNTNFYSDDFCLIYQPVPKYGNVLSSEMGIVEPIVYALRRSISFLPKEMKDFTVKTCETNDFYIIHRLNLASNFYRNLKESEEKEVFKFINELTYSKIMTLLGEVFMEKYNVDLKKISENNREINNEQL